MLFDSLWLCEVCQSHLIVIWKRKMSSDEWFGVTCKQYAINIYCNPLPAPQRNVLTDLFIGVRIWFFFVFFFSFLCYRWFHIFFSPSDVVVFNNSFMPLIWFHNSRNKWGLVPLALPFVHLCVMWYGDKKNQPHALFCPTKNNTKGC